MLSLFMTIIRFVLGKIILMLDAMFSPTPINRSPDLQAKYDQQAKSLQVYQLVACPFCVKVRREVKRLNLNIEYKNVEEPQNQSDLMAGGKQDQVPCLKINQNGSVQWLYESDDIIQYLRKQFD